MLPDGRIGLELEGSRGHWLRLAPIIPDWPFPTPPEQAPRRLCVRQPSRYLHGQTPAEEDARWS